MNNEQTQKYLVVLKIDVADEGDVGLIKIITHEQMNEYKYVNTGFGNIEGRKCKFNKSHATPITDEEIVVLEKFGLTNLEFGDCWFKTAYDDDDDDDDDDDEY